MGLRRKRIGRLVLKRAGGKCGRCFRVLTPDVLWHVDHRTPRRSGGAHSLANLQPLCPTCHVGKTREEVTKREPRFHCPICWRGFCMRRNLLEHMVRHHCVRVRMKPDFWSNHERYRVHWKGIEHLGHRQQWRCNKCGCHLDQPGLRFEVDHVVPFSRGGKTVADNLQLLCCECHVSKTVTQDRISPPPTPINTNYARTCLNCFTISGRTSPPATFSLAYAVSRYTPLSSIFRACSSRRASLTPAANL